MKATLIAFLKSAVEDFKEKKGTTIDRIEVTGGSSQVPVFITAIEEFTATKATVTLPTELKYTLNSIEYLAEGGCLMDMCLENSKTSVSSAAIFSMGYLPPCHFENEKDFKRTKSSYRLSVVAKDQCRWVEKKITVWESNQEMTYALENNEPVMKMKDACSFNVKNNTSVMKMNPSKKLKFPEMYFYVHNPAHSEEEDAEVSVRFCVDKNGIPHIVGEDANTQVTEYFVPVNANTNLASLRHSVEAAEKEADRITPENVDSEDWSMLARVVYNTRLCNGFDAKQKEINALKNECHVYQNAHDAEFSVEYADQIEKVIRLLVNSNKKEDMNNVKQQLEKMDADDQHVKKYKEICTEMEKLYAAMLLKRIP